MIGEVGDVITRRRVLQAGLGAGLAAVLGPELVARAAGTDPVVGGLEAIEHVVFLIQENRSFDHYFGTLRGVRGFDETSPTFAQRWPGHGTLLPFHLDTSKTAGAWVNDIAHDWASQHRYWDGGQLDAFVSTHVAVDGAAAGTATMGYYRRADLPFYYALADAFTICDNYHCSALSPTDPNRLYSVSATLDPIGTHGGPVLSNPSTPGSLSWTTMPERLEAAGVSWKVYQTPPSGQDLTFSNNVLPLFKRFLSPESPLYRNGLLPVYPGEFHADCLAGTLPAVSWVLAPPGFDEHPPAPSGFGELIVADVVRALTLNPSTWARTVLFVTHDEQGGFFDHVAPPTPVVGTRGEYVQGLPVGLGFRVPMLVVSPFSRGGWVCSDTFDHTSMLRFLETRFGVEVPNLSAWRRSVTGDLTTTLGAVAAAGVPPLPQPLPVTDIVDSPFVFPQTILGTPTPPYPVSAHQVMPHQEPGTRPRRP